MLIDCAECGQRIADSAPRCPSCGAATERGRTRRQWVVAAVVIAVLAAGGVGIDRWHQHQVDRDVDRYTRCIEAGGTNETCKL